MNIEEAWKHPWLTSFKKDTSMQKDLLPSIRKGFNGRKMFKKAIDVVKAVNKLSNPNIHRELSPEHFKDDHGLLMPERSHGAYSENSSFASFLEIAVESNPLPK
jgi:hypothetical protein